MLQIIVSSIKTEIVRVFRCLNLSVTQDCLNNLHQLRKQRRALVTQPKHEIYFILAAELHCVSNSKLLVLTLEVSLVSTCVPPFFDSRHKFLIQKS